MIPAHLPPSAEPLRAFDSAWVEFDSIWLKPRLVFDQLTRAGFEACAEICNEVLSQRMEIPPATGLPLVHCALHVDSPGTYPLSFEIPDDERAAPGSELKPRRWRRRGGRRHQRAGHLDPALQLELLSATRILEEMMLAGPGIQALLRRVFTPFQDPELHTMTVREIPPEGSLSSSWVITANGPLRDFANGAALEIPALQSAMPESGP